jgi:hypothetical protein
MVSASLKLSPTSERCQSGSVLGPPLQKSWVVMQGGVSCDTRALGTTLCGALRSQCLHEWLRHSSMHLRWARRIATVRTRREKRTYSLVAKDCVVVRQNLTKPDPLQPLHRSAVVTTRIWCAPHCTVSTLLKRWSKCVAPHSPCAERLHLVMRLGTAQVLQYQGFHCLEVGACEVHDSTLTALAYMYRLSCAVSKTALQVGHWRDRFDIVSLTCQLIRPAFKNSAVLTDAGFAWPLCYNIAMTPLNTDLQHVPSRCHL